MKEIILDQCKDNDVEVVFPDNGNTTVTLEGNAIVIKNNKGDCVEVVSCVGSQSIDVSTQTKGKDGKDGTNGIDGKDGRNGRDGRDGRTGDTGPRGFRGLMGAGGRNGVDGKPGPPSTVDGDTLQRIVDDSVIIHLDEKLGEVRKEITDLPGNIMGEIIGDLASDAEGEWNWFAGDDETQGHFVGSVSLVSMISDLDYKQARKAESVAAWVNNSMAAHRREITVIAEENYAKVEELTTLIAQTNNNIASIRLNLNTTTTDLESTTKLFNQYVAQTDNTMALMEQKITLNTNGVTTNATAIESLQTQSDNAVASIEELREIVDNIDLDGGEISTHYQNKLEVMANGRVVQTGVAMGASVGKDGSYRSEILFMANVIGFLTKNTGAVHTPFIFDVANDTAYLNNVFIKNATITSGKFSDWLDSDAKINGVPILRINFRTGEIQINGSATGGGGRLVITNRLISLYDAQNRLILRLGDWN